MQRCQSFGSDNFMSVEMDETHMHELFSQSGLFHGFLSKSAFAKWNTHAVEE